ncbi:MAG: oxidase [Bdellovibrionales bacterium CG10_big_fil_rev_8_21_14_0_10_45_34]|nr:MAG: oxidase [Bdellovibrionales bacterium CG10_big_fil_rev_8_21_14_0_10_45_34]
MASGNSDHPSEIHVTQPKVFFNVYFVLLVLTVMTVGAIKVDFGSFNLALAMLIATVKAALVIWYFMHQKYETSLNRLAFFSSFFFLFLFFILTAIDVFTRKSFIQL